MLKIFKKTIWIDYADSTVYPSIPTTHEAIAKYCEGNGYSCVFTGDEEVLIEGVAHEIYRGQSIFSRGNYIIKCREK